MLHIKLLNIAFRFPSDFRYHIYHFYRSFLLHKLFILQSRIKCQFVQWINYLNTFRLKNLQNVSCSLAYMIIIIVNAHIRVSYMSYTILCALHVLTYVILSVTLQEFAHFTKEDTGFQRG